MLLCRCGRLRSIYVIVGDKNQESKTSGGERKCWKYGCFYLWRYSFRIFQQFKVWFNKIVTIEIDLGKSDNTSFLLKTMPWVDFISCKKCLRICYSRFIISSCCSSSFFFYFPRTIPSHSMFILYDFIRQSILNGWKCQRRS